MTNRVWYASNAVYWKLASTDAAVTGAAFLQGVQSAGVNMSTEFRQIGDTGKARPFYGAIEGRPNIEVTIERHIYQGSSSFLEFGADSTGTEGNLIVSGNIGLKASEGKQFDLVLAVGDLDDPAEVKTATKGSNVKRNLKKDLQIRAALITSISWKLDVGGRLTESITFTSKVAEWKSPQTHTSPSEWDNTSEPKGESGSTIRWNHFDALNSTFPSKVNQLKGTIEGEVGKPGRKGSLQSFNISLELDRRELPDVGQWRGQEGPSAYLDINKWSLTNLPIVVITELEFMVNDYTGLDAITKDSNFTTGMLSDPDQEIDLQVKNGDNTIGFDLGAKNWLTNISRSGGDTGGANVTASLSFENHNELVITNA